MHVAFDKQQNIYAISARSVTVYVFAKDHTPITSFDAESLVRYRGQKDFQRVQPRCICVDRDNRIFVGGDSCVVRVFAFAIG